MMSQSFEKMFDFNKNLKTSETAMKIDSNGKGTSLLASRKLLDELQSAAKAIGNEELYQKLGAGAKLIRRDIVFAASLYIEG